MNLIIKDIISSFESSSKSRSCRYNDFLAHVYLVFDKQISMCKTDKMMNKYKKMRQSALGYIIANEKAIIAEICKNK